MTALNASLEKLINSCRPIDYSKRMLKLKAELRGGAMIALSPQVAVRNHDVHHPFRQESLFAYLTGFLEQDSAMVVAPDPDIEDMPGQEISYRELTEQLKVTLYVSPKDEKVEIWEGRRTGVDEAKKMYSHVDEVKSINSFWDDLPHLLRRAPNVLCDLNQNDPSVLKIIAACNQVKINNRKKHGFRVPISDIDTIAADLRLVKESSEIARMRIAAEISSIGFQEVMKQCRPGMMEREIHAQLLHTYMSCGSEMEAYPAIVAGGVNACTLHYTQNNQPLKNGDLLLIDSGSQYDYYASDITRTFPVNGKFTGIQKELYEVVLNAQINAIDSVKPGQTLVSIHDKVVSDLVDGVIQLKVCKLSANELIEQNLYKQFYPHGTSHWLGMDVHDKGRYYELGKPLELTENMVFTIEPGIYFQENCDLVDPKYRGIGIRIEDDIAVTKNGSEVLSSSAPKKVSDIESLMQG